MSSSLGNHDISGAPASTRVLVMNDGSIAGLAASAQIQRNTPGSVDLYAWVPGSALANATPGVPGAIQQHQLVDQQAAVLGYASVIQADEHEAKHVPATWPTTGNTQAALGILRASCCALELGCTQLIWPVVGGGDLDAVYAATELAHIIGRIGDLDREPTGLEVQVPFAELTHEQVIELAHELNVPLTTAWAPSGAAVQGAA